MSVAEHSENIELQEEDHVIYENETTTYEHLNLQNIDDAIYEDLHTKKFKKLQSDLTWHKRVEVGVGLLCAVLVLISVAVPLHLYQSNMVWRDQWNNTLTEERDKCQTSFDQLMTRYNQLTEEKEQLQTNFNQLTEEKEQLQTDFNQLTEEKEQLQTNFNQLTEEKEQLQTNFNQLTEEKEQLQTNFSQLTEEKEQLQTNFNQLTEEKEQLQTNFNQLTEEKEQIQTRFGQLWSTMATQTGHLQTSFDELQNKHNSLTEEKEQLQTSFDQLQNRQNQLTVHKGQLQNSFNQLTKQKEQLHTCFDQLKTRCNQTERDPHCDPGWQKFDRGCYYISTEKKTWDKSRQWCRERQSDLIVIKSKEKQDLVASFNKKIHLGLTDRDREGSFQWIDGTLLTTPTYWKPGQPDGETNKNPNAEEDCVYYYDGSQPGAPTRGWSDIPCSTGVTYWMCERAMC